MTWTLVWVQASSCSQPQDEPQDALWSPSSHLRAFAPPLGTVSAPGPTLYGYGWDLPVFCIRLWAPTGQGPLPVVLGDSLLHSSRWYAGQACSSCGELTVGTSHSAFSGNLLVAQKHTWWGYLHYGNWQMLQIKLFFFLSLESHLSKTYQDTTDP